MARLSPHVNFNGNAEEAFRFYRSIFGGEFAVLRRFKEMAGPETPIPEEEAEKILHISLRIGDGYLMANDVPASLGPTNENENRSKIVVSAESLAEADRIFAGLSVGGQVEGPMGDSPWGTRFGCLRDRYGIEWMVVFDPEFKGTV